MPARRSWPRGCGFNPVPQVNYNLSGFVLGAEYVTAFALPNFYFHTTTAYALLRQAGVKLGKRAFIGGMNVQRDA